MTSRIVQFLEYIGHTVPPGARIGSAVKMTCPFHDDSTPSAKVYPDTDTIHCFTCNKTWTVETAYMTYYHVSWSMAATQTSKLFPGVLGVYDRADSSLLKKYSGLDGAAVNAYAEYVRSKIIRNKLSRNHLNVLNQILHSNLPLNDLFLTLKTFGDSL